MDSKRKFLLEQKNGDNYLGYAIYESFLDVSTLRMREPSNTKVAFEKLGARPTSQAKVYLNEPEVNGINNYIGDPWPLFVLVFLLVTFQISDVWWIKYAVLPLVIVCLLFLARGYIQRQRSTFNIPGRVVSYGSTQLTFYERNDVDTSNIEEFIAELTKAIQDYSVKKVQKNKGVVPEDGYKEQVLWLLRQEFIDDATAKKMLE